jgi:hypothetical protein
VPPRFKLVPTRFPWAGYGPVAGPQKRLANSGRRDAHVGLSLVNNGAPSSVSTRAQLRLS